MKRVRRPLATFAGFAVLAGAYAQTSLGKVTQAQQRGVVVTRLFPEGESRPHDGRLLFLLAQYGLRRAASDIAVYDGKGPPEALWVVGKYRREVESGRFRIEISAGQPGGSWRTAAAVGQAAAALEECFCSVGLVQCSGPT